ncbi:Endosulfine-domain-containing protein [Annulohypoxylon truncatum]|uniref:Endosulfine-domain-containing protein n=1 Tax=Annulohypoxylon truncatum TaxID=327061 RepID=UPI00200819FD|nr:Endosulfine-domain-containing protein [Annulohypoxylon truncatum]KAI1207208.1 Endosulfine-domain-containing protein [Annulohypoxylon truncatum]
MNPHQKNKIDVKSLTPDEQRLFRLYGKLPSKSDHFAKHLKERKYFDSGDYAMSKAGKGDSVDAGSVGSQHPVPENIPHLTSPNGQNGGSAVGHQHHPGLQHSHSNSQQVTATGSPVKEGSFLQRETSAEGDDAPGKDAAEQNKAVPAASPTSENAENKGIPIRG